MRLRVVFKIDGLLHILVCLNEIKVRLANMYVINLSELLFPDHLIVVKGALLLVSVQVETEEWLDALQEVGQRFYIELRGRLVVSLIVRVILVFIPGFGSRVNSFCLNRR